MVLLYSFLFRFPVQMSDNFFLSARKKRMAKKTSIFCHTLFLESAEQFRCIIIFLEIINKSYSPDNSKSLPDQPVYCRISFKENFSSLQ